MSKSKPDLSKGLSSPTIRIGFIELVDCAPLLAAQELGCFAAQGVQVELSREVGWATIREKILYRQIDAAHAISGLALSLRLGLEGVQCPAVAPFVFNLRGNAITLGINLWRRGVRDAESLRKLIRSTPQRLCSFGIVSRSSSHNFLLRQWLKQGGLDPNRDVRLVVLPPTQMSSALREGLIDGYCAGEPWNSVAVAEGTGWCPAISEDLAPDHPEKILLTTQPFAEDRQQDLFAVIRALSQACAWCDAKENRAELVKILQDSHHFHVDAEILKRSLIGPFQDGTGRNRDASDFHIFFRNHANEPTRARGEWLVNEFVAHGLTPASAKADTYRAMLDCWRGDLYQQALEKAPKPSPRARKKLTPHLQSVAIS